MPRFLFLLALGLALGAFPRVVPASEDGASRRIALSFDDAPRPDGAFFTGAERTRRLVAGLEAAGVEGALVFATTSNLGAAPDGAGRLRAYARAGHAIGNHSHAHDWLRRSEAADYLADVRTANQKLAALDFDPAFFRHPFLDEGKDAAQRDAVREGLAALGLRNGYVTVDNYDWYLDALAAEALEANPGLDREALRALYVEVLLDAVRFYDDIARDTLGRSPAHVLLLHENDLAALFITDLVAALRAEGWQIIPAEQAYRDPIARAVPDTLFNGQGRVAALAHAAGQPAASLVHPLEDEAALRALFVSRGLLPPAAPTADVVLENATLVAGDGRDVREGMAIRLRGERIVDVAPSAHLAALPGERRVDLAGRWVLPGFVAVHNHLHMPGAHFLGETAAKLYLAGGATTLHTAGSADADAEIALAAAIAAGEATGPRILPSAPYVTGPSGNGPMQKPADAAAAQAFVDHWADRGARGFKLYRHTQPGVAAALVAAARNRRLTVSGHLCSLTYGEAADLGLHRIEHGLLSATDFLDGKARGECRSPLASIAALDADDPRMRALLRKLVASGVQVTSTLAIIESHFPHRPQGQDRALATLAPRFLAQYVHRQEALAAGEANPAYTPALLRKLMRWERDFVALGGTLLAGPDTGRHVLPGFGDQRNFELLHEAGFPLPAVVRIMSANGARSLGLGARTGQLRPGFDADLVVVEGDLAVRPSAIHDLHAVYRGGKRYDPAVLRDGLDGQLGTASDAAAQASTRTIAR